MDLESHIRQTISNYPLEVSQIIDSPLLRSSSPSLYSSPINQPQTYQDVQTSPLILDENRLQSINQEFQQVNEMDQRKINELMQSGAMSFTSATSKNNYHMNRYCNVLAIESSRVKLSPYGEFGLESDYINANYINGEIPGSEKYYIACQAPLPGTIFQFWLMIWQQKSYVILMLTKTVECYKIKASHYWPQNPGETCSFGEFEVYYKEHKELSPVLCQRILEIRLRGETRECIQFHYTEWPDFGIPSSTATIRELARRMEIHKIKGSLSGSNGPVVIHCSAGIGRAGTFIAFHICLEKMKFHRSLNSFDVPRTVLNLRLCRSGMVQTEDQYRFIYHAVRDAQLELLATQKQCFLEKVDYNNNNMIVMNSTTTSRASGRVGLKRSNDGAIKRSGSVLDIPSSLRNSNCSCSSDSDRCLACSESEEEEEGEYPLFETQTTVTRRNSEHTKKKGRNSGVYSQQVAKKQRGLSFSCSN